MKVVVTPEAVAWDARIDPRCGCGARRLHDYCAAQGIPILLEIPDDRRIAEAYARGETLVEALPELGPRFRLLLDRLQAMSATTKEPSQADL
jgi:MinD superfamily P-loop ATPase